MDHSHAFSPPMLSFRSDWAIEVGIEGAVILDAVARQMIYNRASQSTSVTAPGSADLPVWAWFSEAYIEVEFPFLGVAGFRRQSQLLADEGILDLAEEDCPQSGLLLTIIDTRFYQSLVAEQPLGREAIPGFIYLVRSSHTPHWNGVYKIGKSIHPEQRIRRLGVVLPFPIVTEHLFAAGDYSAAERYLHLRFAEKRLDGEWFALTTRNVSWIKSIQSFERDVTDDRDVTFERDVTERNVIR